MSDVIAHKITICAMGTYGWIAISSAEFQEIRDAKRRLLLGLGGEEKIDLILENYAELERCLLDMALDLSIFPGKIDALLDNARHLVNRRIVNLLTTSCLYRDHILHDFSTIYGRNSDSYVRVKQAMSNEYDSVFGYRVMEALRNHAQHRSLPIREITFNLTSDDSAVPPLIRHSVAPSIDFCALEDDPEFKKSVLVDLQSHRDKQQRVKILPFIRTYVDSLGRIHQCVRDVTGEELTKADSLIEGYRTKYRDTVAPSLTGLAAVACDPQGVYREYEYMSDRPINRRRELMAKNRRIDSVSRHYVSSNCE